jgi:hypothetical protein
MICFRGSALLEKERNRYYLVLVSHETGFPGEFVEGQGKSSQGRRIARELLTAASGGAEKRLCCQMFHYHIRSRDVCAWGEGECTRFGS